MGRESDPFYNRKPVPDELIKDVGLTGLTPEEEYWVREKKFTASGPDVRRFSSSNTSGFKPLHDPYYGRKSVSKAEIVNIGPTGLSADEEHWNRERKYSATGVDVRRFSKSVKGGMEPQGDPYYGRKPISAAEIVGVGSLENTMTPAEQYEVRERKQSLFQLSDDPFDVLANRHRQSISNVDIGVSSAATRRRSSAIAPDAAAAHSGYKGDKLAPIESRPEIPPSGSNGEASATNSETVYRDSIDPATKPTQLEPYHDPDSVAPHETR